MTKRCSLLLCALLAACPEPDRDSPDAQAQLLDARQSAPADAQPVADAALEAGLADAAAAREDAAASEDASTPDTGKPQRPVYLLAPSELDFGTLALGCSSRERTFTLYNAGTLAGTLSGASVESADGAFVLTMAPTLPHDVASGSSVDFKVKYVPVAVGNASGTLVVTTLDGRRLEAPLVATAIPRVEQEDVFAQDPPNWIDLLVVIDDSASMATKRQAVIDNLVQMLPWPSCMEVRMAFTASSVDSALGGPASDPDAINGRLLPTGTSGPRYLTNATADVTSIAAMVSASTHPDGAEMPLRSMQLALTEPLLSGENSGFLRPWAYLNVLLITDGEDHGTTPLADYAALFDALKSSRQVFVSAVLPIHTQAPEGCTYDVPAAGPSTRIKDLVAQQGGWLRDICDPNWGQDLASGGCIDFGFRTRFFLANIPNLGFGPLTVENRRRRRAGRGSDDGDEALVVQRGDGRRGLRLHRAGSAAGLHHSHPVQRRLPPIAPILPAAEAAPRLAKPAFAGWVATESDGARWILWPRCPRSPSKDPSALHALSLGPPVGPDGD
ncbi:MAG: choice-of-anchor D domain-containing protein [Myxococcales bacterium]